MFSDFSFQILIFLLAAFEYAFHEKEISDKQKCELVLAFSQMRSVNIDRLIIRSQFSEGLSSDYLEKILSNISQCRTLCISMIKNSIPEIFFKEIAHAIEAHSFSANIQTRSLESQVVQDADRLDSIGAIGLARCFATAAVMKRPFYSEHDSFCAQRPVDDSLYTIDHFYKKLLVIEEKLNTKTAKSIGQRRTEYLKNYLNELKEEI